MKNLIFENPSLKQALCEIRYEPLDSDVSVEMLGKLVPILNGKYPLTEVFDSSPVRVSTEDKVVTHTRNTYKFYSKIHSYELLIKNDAFSFLVKPNHTTKYNNEEFYGKLYEEWENVSNALEIDSAIGIGVRFINKLEVDNVYNNDYFFPTDSKYFPRSGLDGKVNFTSKSEFQIDSYNLLIVTSACRNIFHKNKREFFLDIDRIVTETVKKENIEVKLKDLHKDIKEVFFSSITKGYEEKMRGNSDLNR